ncbi:MAG: response regulator transcription factor [Bacteroidota bacterium]
MSKIKVLYVEDEPFLGKIVKESLESRHFVVKMVADGQEVLSAFEAFQPAICVLDVMLPNVDGFTLAKALRAKNATLPILFLTAKTQTRDLVQGFQSGGNDYIKKPFSMEELIVRIENLLHLTESNISSSKPSSINIGAFTFYPLKYQLVHPSGTRQLSHRETELLKIFTAHQNQAIERKTILLKVWGDDSYFNSRNLDVYIKKLRTYLQADERLKIVTLKGVGYHFSVE